jgi:hypothetical protein
MKSMNYIGLDIHKESISPCMRQADVTIIQEFTITATRQALDERRDACLGSVVSGTSCERNWSAARYFSPGDGPRRKMQLQNEERLLSQ